MWKYFRFGYIHWIWISLACAGFLAGGIWMWAGVTFLFVVGIGGEMVTKNWRDEDDPEYGHPFIHDLIIYSIAAGLGLATFVAAWACSGYDPFGFGTAVNSVIASVGGAYDIFAARSNNAWYDYLGAGLSLGGLLGVIGVSVAHELTHRTTHALDLWVGRWSFALSFGGNFATEHIYNHHVRLGHTEHDPVTPKRGVGFYEFLTVGTSRQWKGGLDIERQRLGALGRSWLSPRNRVLQAWARGAVIVTLIWLAAGWLGFVVWLIAAAFSKYILEGLNFFSHYGVVRAPGEKIALRHTFSSANPLSNHFTFNLGRHGSHHVYESEYYLLPYAEMPESPYGYITMTFFSWIPPLFWRYMVPMLKDWDKNWATPDERALAEAHNKGSGVLALMGGGSPGATTPTPA